MTPQEFCALLNEDLALEYAACLQYLQHAAVIDGLYSFASREMREHAEEEMKHGQAVALIITELGGTPGTAVGPMYVSPDAQAMLQQDLDGEETAIARYDDRVKQAREFFNVAAQPLQEILAQEASHLNDLKAILRRQ